MNAQKVLKILLDKTNKHSAEILAGLGFASAVTATVLAVKATPKALKSIEELKESRPDDADKPIEIVKATWKYYIPPVSALLLSGVCLLFSNSKHHKQMAALAAACSMSETAFKEYRDKVVSIEGDKKEAKIREDIAQDIVSSNPVSKSKVIQAIGGDVLCYDSLSGRYFKSDIETIRRAQNDFNRTLLLDDELNLNSWYDQIGLPSIDVGEVLCWTSERGYLELSFDATLSDEGVPCMVLDYSRRPPEYNRRHNR